MAYFQYIPLLLINMVTVSSSLLWWRWRRSDWLWDGKRKHWRNFPRACLSLTIPGQACSPPLAQRTGTMAEQGLALATGTVALVPCSAVSQLRYIGAVPKPGFLFCKMRKLFWFLDWFPGLFITVPISSILYPSQIVHWFWFGKYGCQTSWVCPRLNLWSFITSVKLGTLLLLLSLKRKFGRKK